MTTRDYEKDQDKYQIAKSFFWMLLSAVAFSGMSASVKLIGSHFAAHQLAFFRSSLNLTLVALILAIQRKTIFVPPKNLKILLGRGFAGFLSLICFFISLKNLPMSVASLMAWCAPLFVVIFSWILLGERTTIAQLSYILVALCGLFLLLTSGHLGSGLPLGGSLIGVLGSVFGALAYVAVRAASKNVSPEVIVFYFSLVATLLCLPFLIQESHMPRGSDWIYVLGIGVFGTAGQMAMTRAYQFAPASTVSTMGLMNPAFSILVGSILFSERLIAVQWMGLGLLFFGMVQATQLQVKSQLK